MFTLISAAAKLPNQTPQPPAGPQEQLVVEAQVHAASAEIGVATANLLPQFGISGDVGSSARRLSDLFKPQP